jgi:hypothetical protein
MKFYARVDGIYQAISNSHSYYQDYSQILIDFSITSSEMFNKKVLVITSLDQVFDKCMNPILIDKDLANPDIASLCKHVPITYAITRQHNVIHYTEPVTLLVPSIQAQKGNSGISMPALVQIINTLSGTKNFLDGIKANLVDKMEKAYNVCETEIFWEKFRQQKKEKKLQIKYLNELKKKLENTTQERLDPFDNSDPAKTMIYMQLQELNAKRQETITHEVNFNAEFSEDEFDIEGEIESSKSYSNIFVIPNTKCFGSTGLECITVESCDRFK